MLQLTDHKALNPQATGLNFTCHLILTLRLLISYIYTYMELLVKPEMLTSYIYGPTFGNAETVSFYLLHNVSTLNQCREVSCVTFVCKYFASQLEKCLHTNVTQETLCIDSVLEHCAANRMRLFQRCQTQVHIYTTLAFLALLGAPYVYTKLVA